MIVMAGDTRPGWRDRPAERPRRPGSKLFASYGLAPPPRRAGPNPGRLYNTRFRFSTSAIVARRHQGDDDIFASRSCIPIRNSARLPPDHAPAIVAC